MLTIWVFFCICEDVCYTPWGGYTNQRQIRPSRDYSVSILLRVNRFLKWYDKQGHLWKWNVFMANVFLRNIQETWCCGQEEKMRISWSVSNQSISNHTYWCALSSNGDEELVLQKSVFNHVANVPEGHGPLLPRC